MKTIIVKILVAALAAMAIWNVSSYLVSPDFGDHVTLKAAPGMSKVQMFATIREGPDVNVTTFADGIRCSKLDGLYKLGSGSTAIYFDKLTCNGITGYVNSDRVDETQ